MPAGDASLYVRTVGKGATIIVLHGGPDFDQAYLAPDLDVLADAYRLVYYDQRGRGRSAAGVTPDEVSLASDIEDVDRIRREMAPDRPVLLGHSWGAVLAMEYALVHPTHVSALVLVNPAPAAAADLQNARAVYAQRLGPRAKDQQALMAGDAYVRGDPEAVAARYRLHFAPAVKRRGDYERLMARMKAGFARQGSEGILKARAVEDRLMRDTWERPGYDLRDRAKALRVPTLVIAGDHDFMVQSAVAIADAIPGARLEVMQDCGHFAFLECAPQARAALDALMASLPAREPGGALPR